MFRKADHYLKFFLSDFNLLKITASRFLMFQTSFSYLKVCCQVLVSSYLTDYDWLSIYIGRCRHIWPHNLPTYKINLDTAVNACWREKKELSEKNSHETWITIGSWFTAMLNILHLCWPPLSLGGPSLSLLEFVIIVFNVSCFKFLNFKKLTRKSSMIPQDLVETQFRGSKICVVITTPHILEVKLSISVNDLSQLAQGFWVSFCQTYGFILSLLYTKIM